MGKSIVGNYTFDASAGTVTIDRNVHEEKLLLITNVEDNIIIYNFSDSTKGLTSKSFNATTNQTTFTLQYDTSTMSDDDNLQVFIESEENTIFPDDTIIDPVSKFRVSNPNTLIDTDFEYGPQATKWESLESIRNIPSFFVKTDSYLENILSISVEEDVGYGQEATLSTRTITVTTSEPHGLEVGNPIDVRETLSPTADGAYIVESVSNSTVFTYLARGAVTEVTGNIEAPYTTIQKGEFFSVSDIRLSNTTTLITIHDQDDIDEGNNEIRIINSFTNGEPLIYVSHQTSNTIPGLTNDEVYYVTNADSQSFQLSQYSLIGDQPFYVYGTANTTNRHPSAPPAHEPGATGYFYPVYLSKDAADKADEGTGAYGVGSHVHILEEYPDIEFWMPNSSNAHATSTADSSYTEYTGSNTSVKIIDIDRGDGFNHQFIRPKGVLMVDAADSNTNPSIVSNTNLVVTTKYKNPFPNNYPIFLNGGREGLAGTYTINGIISDEFFRVSTQGTFGQYVMDFSADDINEVGNYVTVNAHSLTTGDYVIYENPGAGSNTGLEDGRAYFVRALGADIIQFAESPIKLAAGQYVSLDSEGSGSAGQHRIKTRTLSGRQQAQGTVEASASNTQLTGTGTFFQQDIKFGDQVQFFTADAPATGRLGFEPPYSNTYNYYRGSTSIWREDYLGRNRVLSSNTTFIEGGGWVGLKYNDYTFTVAQSTAPPNTAISGGPWTVGEPLYYVRVSYSKDFRGANGSTNNTALNNNTYFTNVGGSLSGLGRPVLYIKQVSSNGALIKLCTDPGLDAAGGNTEVEITSSGSRIYGSSTSYTPRFYRLYFDTSTDVDGMYIGPHNFSNGDIVTYTAGNTSNFIGEFSTGAGTGAGYDLTSGETYSVNVINPSMISVNTYSENGDTVGNRVDFYSVDSGFGTGSSPDVSVVYNYGGNSHIFETVDTKPGILIEKTISSVTNNTFAAVDTPFNTGLANVEMFIPSRIIPRSEAFMLHRSFDGGMEITTSQSIEGPKMIRQTRRYFRYQSGKGLQISNAINFKPPLDIEEMSLYYRPLAETANATTNTIVVEVGGVNCIPTGAGSIQINDEVTNYERFYYANTSGVMYGYFEGCARTASPTSHNVGSRVYVRTQNANNKYLAIADSLFIHNIRKGATIQTDGADSDFDSGTNEFNVVDVIDDFKIAFEIPTLPTSANYVSNGLVRINVGTWQNSILRSGLFDEQNGVFFEYDGSELFAVRRNSTRKISGKLTVSQGDQIVDGSGSKFTTQLAVNDKIVLRGASYQVSKIVSDERIEILPEYRGVSSSSVIGIKTIDTKVPQSQWNQDKMDGTGPSGFNLDFSRIQMAYIDYAWYGAGAVRFGFKDDRGIVKYCHKFKHSNIERIAYMRSGNLPARYEVENTGESTYSPRLAHWGTSVIMDGSFEDDKAYFFSQSSDAIQPSGSADVENFSCVLNEFLDLTETAVNITGKSANFPAAGTIQVTSTGEQMTFTGGAGNTLTVVRAQNGTAAAYAYRGTNMIGSSAVGEAISYKDNYKFPVLSVRLSPSVDNAVSGDFGERDVTNRMQMQLQSIDIVATKACTIDLVINGRISNSLSSFESNVRPSISQYLKHATDGTDVISGGDAISSIKVDTNRVSVDLSQVTALGNSIIGGNGIFPEGPDLLTVVAKIDSVDWISGEDEIYATLNWTESQA